MLDAYSMSQDFFIADLLPPDPHAANAGSILLQPLLAKRILSCLAGPTPPRILIRNGQIVCLFESRH